MRSDADDILDDAALAVRDGEPVDVRSLGRAGTAADVVEPVGPELRGLEACRAACRR